MPNTTKTLISIVAFAALSTVMAVMGSGLVQSGSSSTAAVYTITPSATMGGTISPSNPVTVIAGGSQTFVMTPDPGYHIVSVNVDNKQVAGAYYGVTSSYNFGNVVASHSILVAYALTNTAGSGTTGSGGTVTTSDTGGSTTSDTGTSSSQDAQSL